MTLDLLPEIRLKRERRDGRGVPKVAIDEEINSLHLVVGGTLDRHGDPAPAEKIGRAGREEPQHEGSIVGTSHVLTLGRLGGLLPRTGGWRGAGAPEPESEPEGRKSQCKGSEEITLAKHLIHFHQWVPKRVRAETKHRLRGRSRSRTRRVDAVSGGLIGSRPE